MLVSVQDHSELGAPVSEMVVGDRRVPQESQQAVETVSDHGRADMSDVHRFGNVRTGLVQYVFFGACYARHTQPIFIA